MGKKGTISIEFVTTSTIFEIEIGRPAQRVVDTVETRVVLMSCHSLFDGIGVKRKKKGEKIGMCCVDDVSLRETLYETRPVQHTGRLFYRAKGDQMKPIPLVLPLLLLLAEVLQSIACSYISWWLCIRWPLSSNSLLYVYSNPWCIITSPSPPFLLFSFRLYLATTVSHVHCLLYRRRPYRPPLSNRWAQVPFVIEFKWGRPLVLPPISVSQLPVNGSDSDSKYFKDRIESQLLFFFN